MNRKHIIRSLLRLAIGLMRIAFGVAMVVAGYSLIGVFGILPALILWFELEDKVFKWKKKAQEKNKQEVQ